MTGCLELVTFWPELATSCHELVTFCAKLVTSWPELVTFCAKLVTARPELVTNCHALVTNCHVLVTFWPELVTFCAKLVTIPSEHVPCNLDLMTVSPNHGTSLPNHLPVSTQHMPNTQTIPHPKPNPINLLLRWYLNQNSIALTASATNCSDS